MPRKKKEGLTASEIAHIATEIAKSIELMTSTPAEAILVASLVKTMVESAHTIHAIQSWKGETDDIRD